jgi:hypothetical protein
MYSHLLKEINGIRRNIANGLQLLFFRRVDLKTFYTSQDQLVLLLVLFSTVFFSLSFILSLPDPEYSVYGVATVATQLGFLALGVYFFTRISSKNEFFVPVFIVLLSVWPWFHIAWFLIGEGGAFDYWQLYGENKNIYIIFNLWIALVVVNSVSQAINIHGKDIFKIFAIYVAVQAAPLQYFFFGDFWHQAYQFNDEYEQYQAINQEETYYKQTQLIDNIKSNLLKQRNGISDMYFVGFGSYGRQDVFMKEVQYAKTVFDKKYDTQGRSVALINNIKTLENTPLASKSNLSFVLDYIGDIINPEEDILFLYLTSHGSKQHQLSVDQMPLTLNSIGPADLKTMLTESGIKYRVVLVSACYSGGFIEPLQDDYTLVFTAAAKNKTSFGCGNKSELTYFGRAVFKEQEPNDYNLIDHFSKAIKSIGARENKEKFQSSDPQLFVGNKIREKLLLFTQEIEKFHLKGASATTLTKG